MVNVSYVLCQQDEARQHFNCSTLAGVELENQGQQGTVLNHFEKRVLGVSHECACVWNNRSCVMSN